MYARQTAEDRYSRGLRVPSNYSGNAFRNDALREAAEPETRESDESRKAETEADTEYVSADRDKEAVMPTALPKNESIPAGVGRLFSRGGGGLGFEELLILGLVFLISQNDSKDDLAFLLLMLLFIQ